MVVSGMMGFTKILYANIPQNRIVKGFIACAKFKILKKEEFRWENTKMEGN